MNWKVSGTGPGTDTKFPMVPVAQKDQGTKQSGCLKLSGSQKGFTLLEVIIVIGLVAFIYSVAIPNMNLMSGNEVATRIGQLSEDIRAAYDYSVLTGKPVRMVFKLYSGQYWLEATDSPNVKLGDALVSKDPSPQEDEYRRADFEEEFQKYVELMQESVKYTDSESGDEEDIPEESPVIRAKDQLMGPSWYRLDSLEWSGRTMGDFLIIQSLWSEHHERAISLEEYGQEALGMIYFLPSGYVERAVIHVYHKKDEGEADTEQTPYTVLTHPYEGFAEVRSGYEEIDVHNIKENS